MTRTFFFRNDNGVFVERKGGDSPFSLVSIFQDTQIIYGDFDKDGDIDLDTWDGKSASNDYWQNNGSGVFTKLTNNTQNPFRNLGYRGGFYASATYARVEDWDNDGDDDIYLVIYDTGDNNVLLRNNNGVFTKESGTASPFKDIPQRAGQNNQFIYGDFDADGDLDIQATANNSSFFYYRNNGSGTFTNVSGGNNPFDLLTYKSPFYSTAPKAFVADWDNDGDDDVFTTQWDANNANVLFIQGGAPVKIISTSPVRNSTSASVKANIVLNFNNELNVVAGKDIVIKRANNTTFATIPVSSAQVTGGGSSAITINPTADLDGLTTFYVLIDKGAFVDTDGRPFQGFSTSTDFVFTSAAAPSAPTVTTAAASTIGNTTAALGGNVTADGGASVTDRGIVWGTVSGPSISNNKVQNTSGTGSFNAVVSDLPEGTRVYVRAYATNEIGTSYGSEIDFYTKTRVVSILPVSTSPTNANTLSYNVVFAQSVSGVSSNDFSVITTGSTTASVAGVTGSGTNYAVSITVSGGNGTLRLDLTDPSGTTPNVNQNFTTATSYVIYRVTEATNHFRKLNSSGNWNMAATWESSADFANWIPATLAPTSTASSISMASGSTVTVPQGINASSPTLLNDGVLIVNGVLSVSGSVTSGGTLAGSGTIASSGITSNGTITPGNSPGILSFNGSAVSNGVVNIQLTGSIPGTGYDQLLVSGALSLGGTLNVSLGADYIPAVNDEFTIIDAGSIAGSFATINLPSVSPRVWTTTYNNTNGTLILKVVNDPLPVTITSFDARKSETITLLSWQTSAEINSSHFEIQRNIKNLGWKKIAHVVASGQSGSLRSYNYTDAKPNSGENLYRLKLVDADATFTYSKIVSVHFETTRLSVYPNPVSDKILILDSHIIKNFKLYDTKGVLLESGTSFPGSGLDVRHYVSGMYIINITDEDGKSNNFKFVKN